MVHLCSTTRWDSGEQVDFFVEGLVGDEAVWSAVSCDRS